MFVSVILLRGGVVEILHNLNISLSPGEIIGILGESGAGKSMLMRSLLTVTATTASTAAAGATAAATAGKGDKLAFLPPGFILTGKSEPDDIIPAMIFQDVKACLNPSLRCGQHLEEILRYRRQLSARPPGPGRMPESFYSPDSLLELVGLPTDRDFRRRYPHELSGGMQQRLVIACAVAANADLLIADEALTALDSETLEQVLQVFGTVARELGKTVLLISHSLPVLQACADQVLVMYSGYIVEEGRAEMIFRSPRHPYTRALMESHPSGKHRGTPLGEIPGDISPAGRRFPGCPFAPRCPRQQADCLSALPPITREDGRQFRCLHPLPTHRKSPEQQP